MGFGRHGTTGGGRATAGARLFALAAGLMVLTGTAGLAAARPTAAASPELTLTTPYPAVSIAPGSKESFLINVETAQVLRVDLKIVEAPSGWTATLRGGGWQVAGIMSDPESSPTVNLDVTVPQDATPGAYRVAVAASSGALSDRIEFAFNVAEAAGGAVSFETDFPELRGASSSAFSFNLTLKNDTPRKLVFGVNAVGPEGWDVTAKLSGQEQATTATVEPESSTSVSVSVSPPENATAGTYSINVKAVSGDVQAEQELKVEITGSYDIAISSPTQVLSFRGSVGTPMTQQLTVTNTGTAPLSDVSLSATPPTGWEVTFEPATIPEIPAGQKVDVTAKVTAANEAIAGDYAVTFEASTAEANDSVDFRVTIETSLSWMIVGIAIIALVLIGLFWVFRRYGRR